MENALSLRRAAEADIAFLMRAERGEGYDRLVGRSSEEEHRGFLADPAAAILVGRAEGEDRGFVLLAGLGDRHNGVCMRRIVAAVPDKGVGSAMVPAALDWIFGETPAHRVWLDTLRHNLRAAHLYRRIGFVEEGVFREAYLMPAGDRADRIVFSLLRREWQAIRAKTASSGC